MSERILEARDLTKSFTLHLQGGAVLPVFDGVDIDLHGGECLVLSGASGSGKSTLMRSLFANYKPTAGTVRVRHDGQWVELCGAPPRVILDVRARTVGYVSQFLRVIPRVSALDVVAEPLKTLGSDETEAHGEAGALLARLNLPEHLWHIPPATFSGGEQQRVNIARSFIAPRPVLLLDEPTASLDAGNRDVVVALVREVMARGTGVIGIFHDADVREQLATRYLDVSRFRTRDAA